MSATDNCCQTVINLPGPRGATGPAGTNGTNGVNAYMLATANFTMPAEGASDVASTTDNTAFVVGQPVFFPGLGYLGIVAKPTTTTTTLSNLEDTAAGEYLDNAAPGTIGANGSTITAAGIQGPAGTFSGAAGGDLKGNFPNPLLSQANGLGESIWGDGTDAQTMAAGADGTRLMYDSSQLLGVRAAKVDLSVASQVTGTLQTDLFPALTGDVTKPAGSTATTVPAASITYAKIQNVTDARLLGRSAGSAGSPQEITVGSGLSLAAGALTASGTGLPLVYIRQVKANATPGDTYNVAAGYVAHGLNTTVVDTGSNVVSLVAGSLVLAAGTYRVTGRAPLSGAVGAHRCRLYNVTDSVEIIAGSNASVGALTLTTDSWLEGSFTIAAGKTIQLQTRGTASGTFGVACSFGAESEYYGELWLEKTA